ncbi:MAG: histidine phosphatase family protein [Leptolyngbya sp.]|nr:histidine phosphatase family protein [Leptolyngbya sp.]
MSQLILVRHGQSLWSAANRFTGWVDVPLSERGRAEATIASCKLRDYRVNVCFTSKLMRAMETAVICLTECDEICGGRIPIIKHDEDDPDWGGWDQYTGNPADELPIHATAVLDERYYGALQGLHRDETAQAFGSDQVEEWQRSYSSRVPGGESLEDTCNRVLPFFRDRILLHIRRGDRALVVAHSNSLRVIIMALENLAPEQLATVELATATPIIYDFDDTDQVINKTVLQR